MTAVADAAQNWNDIRDFLCQRVRAQRLAVVRLSGDSPVDGHDIVVSESLTASDLIALLKSTEQQLDHAFARQSRRSAESNGTTENRENGVRDFQSR